MEFLLVIALVAVLVLWFKKREADAALVSATEAAANAAKAAAAEREQMQRQFSSQVASLEKRVGELAKYEGILDADAKAKDILGEASDTLAQAKQDAERERKEANQAARAKLEQSETRLQAAVVEASRIIDAAKRRAEEIAGEAYGAMNRAKEFADTAQAMKNLIEGYGDAYIVPTYNLLDNLAEEFGYTEAGQRLKEARETSRAMVRTGRAATCDYVEENRKETAIRFAVDAFNGKVDSILSRSKADNHGKLAQEIRDAYALVNFNGAAFRNARITEEYLGARLEELKWAATANALKEQEREEQRALREQMREEEKARREYERAIKEAARDEEALRKAMDKLQAQVATASDAQRAEYEAKLRDMEEKLAAAEAKSQRALSMAQQTRAGHVYIISNIGSFGEDVFKIGMTRRLEPTDRIRELGDASVPFEFDIHAMIYSDDAPTLERSLHAHFRRRQLNKVNPRKEFFRVELADIRSEVSALGIEAQWTMAAEALQYRETLRIEQQILENPQIAQEWAQVQEEIETEIEEEEVAA
ncbi:GIY-YIG nuclease family protein [Rhodocyclus purpureus]|uniref:GIY-YIG nuclease family protein n=1 Tax=Rhodocyclus purpureus TaxID=1067 RepID=UPI001911DB0B|nr:GIY-YIG nuclease family protein [Rhodocyclus purpureus]MBK5915126.1 chromosome segregation ATPase [Rhodocyclus purpureus]